MMDAEKRHENASQRAEVNNGGEGTPPITAPETFELVFDGPIRFYAEIGAAYGNGHRLTADAGTALKLAQDYGDVYIDLDAALRNPENPTTKEG